MKRIRSIFRFLGRIEGLTVALVLALLYGVFILTAPQVFTGYRIYMSFLQTIPPVLVLALGLTLVVTAGEIDLSFSAVVALSGFVFAYVFKNLHTPWAPWAGFALALAAGALVGYVNGILVAIIRVPSIMATVASQFFWYGITVLLANGLQLNIREVTTTAVHTIFVGRIFGPLPLQAFWALLLAIFLWFILNRHKFGEEIMFVGDNAEVARVMGINVGVTKIKLFTLMGVIAAFAGLLLTLEINVFYPTQGQGFLLPVMAAVFVGGTAISGGMGSIVGTFFGAYIMGSLEAGVVATGITSYWVQSIEGLVMAASIVLNTLVGEGRFSKLSVKLRDWILPAHTNATGTPAGKNNSG